MKRVFIACAILYAERFMRKSIVWYDLHLV